ncbi:vWA-MoxR associated conflict system protein [Streptomyces sp. NPDC002125]
MVRHVIVVASQCSTMPELGSLEAAARDLHAVLTDPHLGGAEPTDDSFLLNPESPEDVTAAVHAAATRAQRDGAVLIVALLGHGFTTPALRFMVQGSRVTSSGSAVDVPGLLGEVANEAEGVIALIDTCHAGAAPPPPDVLASGVRAGQVQFAVIMAAAADQDAYGMNLSVALASVIRRGLDGRGQHLLVDDELMSGVRAEVRKLDGGQTIGRSVFDQYDFAVGPLWLAHNARASYGAGSEIGPVAARLLDEASEGWPDRPARWTHASLTALLSSSAADQHPAQKMWVEEIKAGLQECRKTVQVLKEHLPDAMRTHVLRTAANRAGFPASLVDGPRLRDLVEHAVLGGDHFERSERSRHDLLGRLVAALLVGAGITPPAELNKWIEDHGDVESFKDAYEEFQQWDQSARTRLVLGIPSLAGRRRSNGDSALEWPRRLHAWVIQGGKTLGSNEFEASTRDEAGLAAVIKAAIRWARSRLPAGERLQHIDIAACGRVLAQWHPEEARTGLQKLGIAHRVTLRWNNSIVRDEGAEWDASELNYLAEDVLESLEAGNTELSWLGLADIADLEDLVERLASETGRPWALEERPAGCDETLATLAAYAPILIWPEHATAAPGQFRATVDGLWNQIRNEQDWQAGRALKPGDGTPNGLRQVRRVWHDRQWLDFCKQFEPSLSSPEEETS